MRNNYRPKNRYAKNKPSNNGNRGYSKNRGNNSRRRYSGNKARINHEQYISKAVTTEQESLYIHDANFNSYNLDQNVKINIRKRNFVNPTKIQNSVIPEILLDRDILGLAGTGSGKTAAFLLPMITKAIRNRNEKCLIVAPTRELATQIMYELRMFSQGTNVFGALIVGGAGYGPQIRALNSNPQFVIATPGRLLDLYNTKRINLKSFNNVVLDEVDRMLDMGFIKDIEFIISKMSDNKQSLFFSATMNDKAEVIARKLLKNPIKIQVSKQRSAQNVEQNIIKYNFVGEKINMLDNLLAKEEFEKVLVFSRTRKGADSLARELIRRGHKSAAIHGEKSHGQRIRTITEFRKNNLSVLVATDVAARGIDIPNISHIINYDEPENYDDYIHRIGRTGRIGKKGVALTFVR
ncbi:DEAD/DEAH box helicase [Patescibacteria group bacterium]